MNHKVSRIRQPVSPGVIGIRLPAKPEVTLKICSYSDSRFRRFTRLESRNLNQENVRAWLAWWHQQYPRTETTRDGTATGRAAALRGQHQGPIYPNAT